MDYEKFKEEVKNRIKSYLPAEYSSWKVTTEQHYKVNQKLDGLSVVPADGDRKNGAYPVFYLQDLYLFYESGYDLGHILRDVANMMVHIQVPEAVKTVQQDFEVFRDKVVLQLINREKNLEFLKDKPHRCLLDFAVIYRILVNDGNGDWSGMTVTDDILKEWNMTEPQLYEQAFKYTPEILPFVMREVGSCSEEGEALAADSCMILLTNESLRFGAVALLYPDILKMAESSLGGDYIILPGSMHELYLVKPDMDKKHFYKHVVIQANRDVVAPEEWLSDNVYLYDSTDETVKILL